METLTEIEDKLERTKLLIEARRREKEEKEKEVSLCYHLHTFFFWAGGQTSYVVPRFGDWSVDVGDRRTQRVIRALPTKGRGESKVV